MIIKVLPQSGDFQATIGYLLNKRRPVAPEVLHREQLLDGSPDYMAMQCERIAAQRPEVHHPVHHLVISWHRSDRPSDDQMVEVAQGVLKTLTVPEGDHQVLAVAHRDTDESHLHLVINRVGLSGDLWYRKQDAKLLQAYRREADEVHGWVRPDGRGLADQLAATAVGAQDQEHLRGYKRIAHVAIADAIARSDGSLEGFVGACKDLGQILPDLSFNRSGFNGASFALVGRGGQPLALPGEGDEPRPLVFKGAQVGWPKRKLEAALVARREYLASAPTDADPTGAQRSGLRGAKLHDTLKRRRAQMPRRGERRTSMRRIRLPGRGGGAVGRAAYDWLGVQRIARLLDRSFAKEVTVSGADADLTTPLIKRSGPIR